MINIHLPLGFSSIKPWKSPGQAMDKPLKSPTAHFSLTGVNNPHQKDFTGLVNAEF
uniref:Uncharacterized protein n=2 Tax=Anguilla anguilla TaxID=7936 RepID=A0A0E9T9D3_ANGAN